jgi:hypothetical protein
MSANPQASGADARFETVDWDAKLAEISAEQGFGPATADGEPARDDDRPEAEPQPEAAPTPRAARDAPEEPPADAPPPTAEEVRISKREWEETQRRLNQYGQNLQQQREEFDRRVQQAIAGQGPDIERRMADARREGERAAINAQIRQIADPDERQRWQQRYQGEWDAEDRQLAAERERAEAQQIKTQAEQQIQHAQQATNYAQAQMVATNMTQYLEGFTPMFAAKAGQLLGSEVAEDEIKAFVTRPEFVQMASQMAYQGPNAINQFGEMLTQFAAAHVRDQRQARETAAQKKREGLDNAGLGRDQGGSGARRTIDLNQYKSTKDRPGDPDAMLRAINEQQGIRVAR